MSAYFKLLFLELGFDPILFSETQKSSLYPLKLKIHSTFPCLCYFCLKTIKYADVD